MKVQGINKKYTDKLKKVRNEFEEAENEINNLIDEFENSKITATEFNKRNDILKIKFKALKYDKKLLEEFLKDLETIDNIPIGKVELTYN